MSIVGKTASFLSRVYRTARAVRKCWRDGGAAVIQVAQIHYGEILKGRHVLITGGSRGIGFAIAKKCVSEGATVVITGRDPNRLDEAVRNIGAERCRAVVWDVSRLELLEAKLNEAISKADGEFDVLVNNAGILGGSRSLFDLTESRWDEIMSVNAKAVVFLTQKMVARWLALGRKGKIINISSVRGVLGVTDGPYGMSKWALNGLTQGLARMLAPKGIIVNGIAPGITDTSIEGIDATQNAFSLWAPPMNRIAIPEEIAELAVFLMSDAANYIVGQTIVCDGGYTLR